jgi:3-oxoacyl-[acyl-carrier protein] reductase
MRLPNRVALITGAASGIGRASAILFAREGAKVAVADIDEVGGMQTVESIVQQGGTAIFVKADITKAEDVERMIRTTAERFGKLDILFNNAGIGTSFTPLEEVDEALYDRVMAINVKSVFLGCKYAAPVMKANGGGVIVNTASISGVRPRPGLTVYAASKGAVIVFTKAIAIELAPYKIRVNCINPVVTDTAFITKTIAADQIDAAKKGMLSTIPLGRMGEPEDMAAAALYLASDDASLVTGVSLDVDGGRAI